MNQTMRVIAVTGDYLLEQTMSGCIVLHDAKTNGRYVYDSAYDAICHVKDKDAQAELLRQWKEDVDTQAYAERNSKGVEFHATDL